MFLIILSWAVNGFFISLIYLLGMLIFNKGNIHSYYWLLLGYLTITIYIAIGTSKAGPYLLRLYFGYRKPISSEKNKVEPVLLAAMKAVNQVYGDSFKIENLKILVIDDLALESLILGSDTIVLTNMLIRTISDYELAAILIHGLGRLYSKEGVLVNGLIFSNLAGSLIVKLYLLYLTLTKISSKLAMNDRGIEVYLFRLMFSAVSIIFFPLFVLRYIFNWILNISLGLICRRSIYQADRLAKEAGYKDGLISFLEVKGTITQSNTSIVNIIFASYPPVMERIHRLEK